MTYYCYILNSNKSHKYYIGSTKSLVARLKRHNAGKVRSTKHDLPWAMVHKEAFPTLKEARRRELQIKKWKSRKAIERLINNKNFNQNRGSTISTFGRDRDTK